MSVAKSVANFISFMIIRTLGPNCVNRDEFGNIKTAFFGGRERRRVSSQCDKRSVRKLLNQILDALNYRTQEIPRIIKEELDKASIPQAIERLAKIFSDGKTDGKLLKGYDKYKKSGKIEDLGTFQSTVSLFLSKDEKDLIVEEAKKPLDNIKSLNNIIKDASKRYGAVIALFGRFMAEASEMTLESASSFSHEISTHEVMSESDYFILENELGLTAGGSHLNYSSFSTATTYYHAVLDLETLKSNLPGFSQQQIQDIVGGFVEALVKSFPEGRKNSLFSNTLPDYIRADVTPMPISMFSAFEEPVMPGPNGGYKKNSIAVLEAHRAEQIDRGYEVVDTYGGAKYKIADLIAFARSFC